MYKRRGKDGKEYLWGCGRLSSLHVSVVARRDWVVDGVQGGTDRKGAIKEERLYCERKRKREIRWS